MYQVAKFDSLFAAKASVANIHSATFKTEART